MEELRERQHLAAEEGREKAKMLEERERVCVCVCVCGVCDVLPRVRTRMHTWDTSDTHARRARTRSSRCSRRHTKRRLRSWRNSSDN